MTRSFGYKGWQTITTFVTTGIVLLVLLNSLIVLVAIRSAWTARVLLGTLLMAYIFWKLYRLLTKLTYMFEKDAVTIVLPNQKEIVLAFAHINAISPLDHLPRWQGWGIIALPHLGKYLYTTSSSHILHIEMHDGTDIYISPKTYPNDLTKLHKPH